MATIDNPPAQPNQQEYPLVDLDIYAPRLTSQPAGIPVNLNAPAQVWMRPIQTGENPKSDILMPGWWDTSQSPPVYVPNLIMTIGQAATPNVPPQTGGPLTAAEEALAIYQSTSAIPARNFLPNEQFAPGSLPGTIPLVERTDMAPVSSDATETRIINGVNAILTALGKPTV